MYKEACTKKFPVNLRRVKNLKLTKYSSIWNCKTPCKTSNGISASVTKKSEFTKMKKCQRYSFNKRKVEKTILVKKLSISIYVYV